MADCGVLARLLPEGPRGVAVLRDTEALLRTFAAVQAEDPIADLDTESEWDRQRWVSAAEHALRIGRSPVRLFTSIVTSRPEDQAWAKVSNQADEAARLRLAKWDREQRGF